MAATELFTFHDTDDRDRASDGVSRYGVYLRQNFDRFADWDHPEQATTDPVDFVMGAWQVATPPIMSGYLDWNHNRIQNITTQANAHDGSLTVRVQLAVPRPAQLADLRRFTDWNRVTAFGHTSYYTPDENVIARQPALLTNALLLIPIRPEQLHTPTDAPQLTVADAKAAIKRLAALLEPQLAPVLDALDQPVPDRPHPRGGGW
jgi:hypothetical protein